MRLACVKFVIFKIVILKNLMVNVNQFVFKKIYNQFCIKKTVNIFMCKRLNKE